MMSSNEFTLRRSAAPREIRGAYSIERATAAVDARERVAGFDVLRLGALLAIVWFHTGAPGAEYTAWRLPTLAIISATLAAGRAERRPLPQQIRKTGARLLLPWLFWCGVYGVVELATYLRHGTSIVDELGGRVFLTGTSVHLWYLPFAFAMILFINLARRLTAGVRPTYACLLPALLAVLSLAVLAIDRPYEGDVGTPAPQWLRCLPAVFLGLAVGTATRHASLRRSGVIAVVLVNSAACALIAIRFDDPLAVRYGLAMLLVALASTWRFEPPRWVAAAVGMAMGVYLVHMSIHRLVYAVSNRLPTPDLSPAAHAVVVIAFSFAAVWALSQSPLKRFV
ncbi:acyltransferase family protein [Planctomyces sp. SH-PL62]|uniref:acyltransferase family protein n=1 Tax=Planctomyces sp. SH-PL62 TaxID=1636152 RepID=UPI000838EDAC|nr:acyltransferase [Planctomyces sp. SH-PL62]